MTAALQPVHQRITQPAQQRAEHERGQDRCQHPHQPCHPRGHRQPADLAQEPCDLVLGTFLVPCVHRIRYSPACPSTATTGASVPSMRSNPDMPVSRSRSNSTRPPSACAGAIRRTTGIFCSIADTRR